jgi:glycosyltransferase involved in cell wall biosynthesis
MRLVVLTEDFYPSVSGGAHEQWGLCRIAAERGHDVTVFTSQTPDTPAREVVEGVDVRRPFAATPFGVSPAGSVGLFTRLFHSALLFAYLLRWLRGREIDGLYSASNTLHWVATALANLYRLRSANLISYTPTLDPDEASRPRRLLERLSFAYALGPSVLCRTPAVRDVVVESVGPDTDVEVVHGILDPECVRAGATADHGSIRTELLDDGDYLLAFVGRLTELKRAPEAVRALAALPPGYRLAVVGDGPDRERVRSTVEELGVGDRVQLLGELPHEAALAVLAASDALVLPSRTESYSTVALEALALGSTVFAGPVGVLPAVDHERLVVVSDDDFADAIAATTIERSATPLDEATLRAYGMDRYTDAVLDRFEESRPCRDVTCADTH